MTTFLLSESLRRPHEARPLAWVWLARGAAALGAGGSLLALLDVDGVYGRETPAMVPQCIAQDVVNLLVVAPLILTLTARARVRSVAARLVVLGLLLFTAYSYVIYSMAVHVGRLSLLWMAVLGLSTYAGLGLLRSLLGSSAGELAGRGPVRGAAAYLVVVASVLALVWLGELVPAAWAGTPVPSAAALGLPSNPVHTMDLAVLLPAVVLTGILLPRRRPTALVAAPALLVFLLLTCVPVLVTPVVVLVRGGVPDWDVAAPIGAIGALSAVFLQRLLRRAP